MIALLLNIAANVLFVAFCIALLACVAALWIGAWRMMSLMSGIADASQEHVRLSERADALREIERKRR